MRFIEKNKPLSKSLLWQLQQLAYNRFGPDAWAKKGVPFYLTSNPLIAKQFSFALLAFLQDLTEKKKLNLSEPFYIFDLGAGSGRLGFLILKYLLPWARDLISSELKICYIMADMVESNLEFLQDHSFLQPFIESENLEFAKYHHTEKTPIELILSKKILDQNAITNPIALVCTYFFDTVPQDLFKVQKGSLEEGRISLLVPENLGDGLSPEMIMNLEASFSYRRLENPEKYYPERLEWGALLVDYVKLLEDSPFLFPLGALESISYFSELSKGRLLLLAADQGVATTSQVKQWGEPKIFRHASFSMAVSYHLLAKYFESKKGVGLLTSFPQTKYVLILGILGGKIADFPRSCHAFYQQIDSFEPIDYWELINFAKKQEKELSLEQIILYIKLGNWDPINFYLFFSEILQKTPKEEGEKQQALSKAIYKVWENFFPISLDEGYFVMNLGVLFFEMKKYKDALFFFLEAEKILGEQSQLTMNMSKCHFFLGDKKIASELAQKAIFLNQTSA